MRAASGCSAIHNYSDDAGAGSQIITNISESPAWRAMLLGTVAAGSLWLYSARSARAACAPYGTTVLNCTDIIAGTVAPGVVNGGILVPNTYTTLNVYDLEADITPNAGVDGIFFHRTGAGNDVIINSDTGPFDIIVNGAGASGIVACSQSAINITHTGDIDASAGLYGINARVSAAGTGPLSIISEAVTGGNYGISADNRGTGTLSIVANGDVIASGTTTSTGIYARSSGMSLNIVSESVSGYIGIVARNYGIGALEILAKGNVEGTAVHGIVAANNSLTSTDLSVISQDVSGFNFGIFASNNGTGALEIVANGDVMGTSDAGIIALQSNAAAPGPLTITTQAVTGGEYGIRANNYGSGALTIKANGDVEATRTDSVGIYARNYYGADGDGIGLSISTKAQVTSGVPAFSR